MEVVSHNKVLRAVQVRKARRQFVFHNCVAEFVRLHVGAIVQESFCLEDADPSSVIVALRELGLDRQCWTSYRLSSINRSVCKRSGPDVFDGSPPTSVDHSTVLASSRTLRAGSRRRRGAASETTLALGALPPGRSGRRDVDVSRTKG